MTIGIAPARTRVLRTRITRPGRRPVRMLSPTTVLAVLMLVSIVALVAVVPLLPSYDVNGQDLSTAMLPPFQSPAHLLGTDSLGRDVASRLALAGRVSLLIVISAVAINLVVGVILGLTAGYFGRWADTVISGVADLQVAIPVMLLLIVVVSVLGPSTGTLILVLGLTYWVAYGRSARAIAIAMRDRDYVISPITQGASAIWVIRKHLLPKVLPQVFILASFDVGVMITISSSLDYLGLGVQAPTPTWGGMIAEGQPYLQANPWLVVLPSLAIFFLVGSVQFLSQRFTGENAGASTIPRIQGES